MNPQEVVIEGNISTKKYRGWSAVLIKMKINDSFFVPEGKMKDPSSYFGVYANRLGIRIMTRKMVGGVRVWRIE